jgi:nucleotide-binding universal stress UspA family protein
MALAQACGSKINLLQILEFNPEFEAQAPDLVARREDEVHAHLETMKDRAAEQDVLLEPRVRRCETAYQGIVEEAEKLKPDLIIMGRRGRSRLFRLMMGNVTARVIAYSPVNVLAVPKNVPLQFKRILIASDGSANSQAAWKEALHIARRLGSGILALSVARQEEDKDRAEAIVADLEAAAAQAGVPLTPLALQGRTAEMIVKAARDNHIDLIVMGARGLTNLETLLMGRNTERVIAQAPCAVLVVKTSA